MKEHVSPDALCLLVQLKIDSVLDTVAHKSSKLLVIYFICYKEKKIFVKFEMLWELNLKLVNTIEKLDENW